jgi:hypothetical protein
MFGSITIKDCLKQYLIIKKLHCFFFAKFAHFLKKMFLASFMQTVPILIGYVVAKWIQWKTTLQINQSMSERNVLYWSVIDIVPILLCSQFIPIHFILCIIIGISQILIVLLIPSRIMLQKHYVNVILYSVNIIGCFISIYIEICRIIAVAKNGSKA